ncbi:hypothetical protein ACW9YV_23465 (plasmid) [Paraburkholderia strydomiana]
MSSLTLMRSSSAVAAIARFCAGVTNTTVRSLGFVMIGSHTCWHGA